MKIIKYFFLLLVLVAFATTVFIGTQKSDFFVQRSNVINVPKSIVFNYMNDFKNWEAWDARKEDDATIKYNYPELTIGKGAYYSWNGSDGTGKIATTFVKINDSIVQKAVVSDNEYHSNISFKDTIGGTKVTWISKGKVDFMTKIKATFSGGINQMMGTMYERNLSNLNRIILKEINTFNVKVNGITKQNGGFYVKQSVICKASDKQAQLNILLPKMIRFFKKNNMAMNGKPYVIYENISNDTLRLSVCGPLREEIFMSNGSDISTGYLEPFTALKTTLTGDYSHFKVAKQKAQSYLKTNNIEPNPSVKSIEIYVRSASDIKSPSKWVTEILLPVKSNSLEPVAVQKPIATVTPSVTP